VAESYVYFIKIKTSLKISEIEPMKEMFTVFFSSNICISESFLKRNEHFIVINRNHLSIKGKKD